MKRCIMLLYSRVHQRGDASRLWRVERSSILLLFWRLGLRRRPLALSELTAISKNMRVSAHTKTCLQSVLMTRLIRLGLPRRPLTLSLLTAI